MGKILKTINLVIDAIKPKQVTWTLDKNGIEYKKIDDEYENNFERYLTNDTLENLKKNKENSPDKLKRKKDDVFELYLTDSGIPWIQTKKPVNKTENNIQDIKKTRFSKEEIKYVDKNNFETVQSIQEALNLKTKIMKKTLNRLECGIPVVKHCNFTPEELSREKLSDAEVCKRLKVKIESKFKIQQNIRHCSFTSEELAREKQADCEVRRRLKEMIESKFKIDNQILLSHFFDSKKGAKYYLNRYNNELNFKEWFDSTFPEYTIEEALQIAIPDALKSKEADTFDPHKDLQNYIDIYKNDPIYKEWFDKKFPGQSIYEIIGSPET